jgi:uncharacterized protein YchJ
MKYNFRNIILVAAMVFIAGCNKSAVATKAAVDPVAVMRGQIDALNREDTAAALAVIDPDSPVYQPTKDISEKISSTYHLRYTLKEIALESENGSEAKVRFVQITEKLSGPEFRNNQIEGVHILRKKEGQWKLYNTEVSKLVYLDK